jgi:ribose-phosphate pyrophosphokinase
MKLITCSSNRPLAEKIASRLHLPLTRIDLHRFKDQEIFVRVNENVRGQDVFCIQSTSKPANDHLMELLVLIDALKRGSARRITALIPYFGYARQDRKTDGRTPISAKLVANLLETAGAHRVLTLDLHAGQIQGFFNIPLDDMMAAPLFTQDIERRYSGDTPLVVVSPDVGGVVRARHLAERVGASLAIIDKRRPHPNEAEVMNVIGDIDGRACVLVDDIVDTAGTLCSGAKALADRGAASVSAYITHGVLSGQAIERISNSILSELVITDSIQPNEETRACGKIRVLSVGGMMAGAIHRVAHERSVSVLLK